MALTRLLWPLFLCLVSFSMAVNLTVKRDLRCIMYFTGYESLVPVHALLGSAIN
jgi:hypothetical protein